MKKLLLICVVFGFVAYLVMIQVGPFSSESRSQFDLTIHITNGGTVTQPGDVHDVDQGRTFSYDEGTGVDLEAVPLPGYSFVNWTGNIHTVADITATTTTIVMSADYTITANFVNTASTRILTIDSTDGGSVTVPGENAFTYDPNTEVELLAVPDDGYTFVNWTSDDEDAVDAIDDEDAAQTTITMDGNYSITANFGATYTLTVGSTDGGSVTVPGEGEFTYGEGAVISLVAEVDDDSEYEYLFVNWTGDVDTVTDVNAAETTITLNGDCTVTANFVRWVVRYDGDASGTDQARAVAVDSAGNIYVTGSSQGTNGYDYVTVKYNSDFDAVWTKNYNNASANGNDYASAMAMDGAGNVYITGYSYSSTTNYDYATVKYDSNGNEQWVARYDGAGDWDEAKDIAVDASGNVYVTGYVQGSNYDCVTVKYDSDGNEQWARTYDRGDRDMGNAIAVDGNGNVYVTGYSYDIPDADETRNDYATVKYDSDGNEQWAAIYDGPANGDDYARAIAVDGSGNVYVTGQSADTNNDYATVKYNSSGTQQWAARYDGPASEADVANSIGVDSAGNVYVTGQSQGDGTNDDYATVKYNSAGTQQWVARYDGEASGSDLASAMAMDADGNIYVTGSSEGSSTNYDYATIAYNSDGTELWDSAVRYSGPHSADYANAIAIDGDDNVYVTGSSKGVDTDNDYATIRIVQ